METKLRTENKMGTMPVGRLLANMALPMVISMLVQALYNVVDSVYVSRVSENALTAVSMAFPIQNLMIGFSTGVGVGMNSLLSKCLGSREYDRGNLTAGNGLVLSGICCLLFMLFGAFGAGVFFRVQTDIPEILTGGVEYLQICTLFSFGIFGEILFERLLQPGDVLFISEKCVACTQKRAIPMEEIHPRKLAYTLSKYVTKTPHGIGLGMPETMEYALRECGTLRILFAAFVSVIGKKVFRKKGWFYKVAGYKARSIDGPCHNTIPPYNHYVVLGPVNPDQVARDIKARIGFETCIVAINDLEGQILGVSSKALDKHLYARILKDNPLGQDDQQTPMGIIRKL